MSVIATILEDLADRLSADEWFEDIAIVREDKGDVLSVLAAALAPTTGAGGKSGAAVVLTISNATSDGGDEAGPYFSNVQIAVQCLEQLVINRDATTGTGKSALAIAEMVAATLANERPDPSEQPLFIESMRQLPFDPENSVLAYEVIIRTAFGLARPNPEEEE